MVNDTIRVADNTGLHALIQGLDHLSAGLDDKNNLMLQYLSNCSYVYGCKETARTIEEKIEMLESITKYLSPIKNESDIPKEVLSNIFSMFTSNVFRPLPPQTNYTRHWIHPEECIPVYNSQWTCLEIVYAIMLRAIDIMNPNARQTRLLVCEKFVESVVVLFDNEDPREKDALKRMLHKIYGKFVYLRNHIRRCMGSYFLESVYDKSRHNGVAELLEVTGSIINGYIVPVKEEHREFLERVLIPLHSSEFLAFYCIQLLYCTIQYVEKGARFSVIIISKLLKIWPNTCTAKQVIFLTEIEAIVERMDISQFDEVVERLFYQIGSCISSPHFQVSERAHKIWNNTKIVKLMSQRLDRILPITFPQLMKCVQQRESAGNSDVFAINAIQVMFSLDENLFNQLVKEKSEVFRLPRNPHLAIGHDN